MVEITDRRIDAACSNASLLISHAHSIIVSFLSWKFEHERGPVKQRVIVNGIGEEPFECALPELGPVIEKAEKNHEQMKIFLHDLKILQRKGIFKLYLDARLSAGKTDAIQIGNQKYLSYHSAVLKYAEALNFNLPGFLGRCKRNPEKAHEYIEAEIAPMEDLYGMDITTELEIEREMARRHFLEIATPATTAVMEYWTKTDFRDVVLKGFKEITRLMNPLPDNLFHAPTRAQFRKAEEWAETLFSEYQEQLEKHNKKTLPNWLIQEFCFENACPLPVEYRGDKPSWLFWASLPAWTVEQAAALLCGLEPGTQDDIALAQENKIRAAVATGALTEKDGYFLISDFLKWAQNVPSGLREALKLLPPTLAAGGGKAEAKSKAKEKLAGKKRGPKPRYDAKEDKKAFVLWKANKGDYGDLDSFIIDRKNELPAKLRTRRELQKALKRERERQRNRD